MTAFLQLPTAEQRGLIMEAAQQLGVVPAVVEKDLWVCLTLDSIFSSEKYGQHVVFKGGTSLSKVFNVIHRFSEDIDLILDWGLMGYSPGHQDPWADRSNTQQDKFNKAMLARAGAFIAHEFPSATVRRQVYLRFGPGGSRKNCGRSPG